VWMMITDAGGQELMPKSLRSLMRSFDLPFKDTWSVDLCVIKLATYLRGRVLPLDSLSVRKSLIPAAGMGLFAERDFTAGEWICTYFGRPVPLGEMVKRADVADSEYTMGGFGTYSIDARDERGCLAKYINDGKDDFRNNVQFVKLRRQRKALVIAMEDIPKGSELLAFYGEGYWRKRDPEYAARHPSTAFDYGAA